MTLCMCHQGGGNILLPDELSTLSRPYLSSHGAFCSTDPHPSTLFHTSIPHLCFHTFASFRWMAETSTTTPYTYHGAGPTSSSQPISTRCPACTALLPKECGAWTTAPRSRPRTTTRCGRAVPGVEVWEKSTGVSAAGYALLSGNVPRVTGGAHQGYLLMPV